MRAILQLGKVLAFVGFGLQPAVAAACSSVPAAKEAPSLKSAYVNGVELHYCDHGSGVPVVFVHGGLADYREWEPVAAALPAGFRTLEHVPIRWNHLLRKPMRKNKEIERPF